MAAPSHGGGPPATTLTARSSVAPRASSSPWRWRSALMAARSRGRRRRAARGRPGARTPGRRRRGRRASGASRGRAARGPSPPPRRRRSSASGRRAVRAAKVSTAPASSAIVGLGSDARRVLERAAAPEGLRDPRPQRVEEDGLAVSDLVERGERVVGLDRAPLGRAARPMRRDPCLELGVGDGERREIGDGPAGGERQALGHRALARSARAEDDGQAHARLQVTRASTAASSQPTQADSRAARRMAVVSGAGPSPSWGRCSIASP